MSRIDQAFSRAAGDVRRDHSHAETGVGLEVAVPWDLGSNDIAPPPAVTEPPATTEVVASPELAPARPKMFTSRLNPEALEKLVVTPLVDPRSIEQYRRSAALLHLTQAQRPIKIVMVASAEPGEGKTLTATNLALTLSGSYRRSVLLIDADFRRPAIHNLFQIPNVSGLSDGLKSASDQKIPLVRYSEYLSILPAGKPDPDPMSALTCERMQRVLGEATASFDWVVIDTPPIGLLPDAHLLAAMADTVLLVVRAGRTGCAAVKHAIAAIGRDRILGVILNGVDHPQRKLDKQYYTYVEGTAAASAGGLRRLLYR